MTIREFFEAFDYDWEEEGKIEVFICEDRWVNECGNLECEHICDTKRELEWFVLDDYGDYEFIEWTSYIGIAPKNNIQAEPNRSVHLVIGFIIPSIE